ncbi:MAG: hypothetical protein K6F53_10820 [Lachnospiraceae bacterium]|nr:hypothetical protein [Lachnospiraceae bacterium]
MDFYGKFPIFFCGGADISFAAARALVLRRRKNVLRRWKIVPCNTFHRISIQFSSHGGAKMCCGAGKSSPATRFIAYQFNSSLAAARKCVAKRKNRPLQHISSHFYSILLSRPRKNVLRSAKIVPCNTFLLISIQFFSRGGAKMCCGAQKSSPATRFIAFLFNSAHTAAQKCVAERENRLLQHISSHFYSIHLSRPRESVLRSWKIVPCNTFLLISIQFFSRGRAKMCCGAGKSSPATHFKRIPPRQAFPNRKMAP